MSSTLCFHLPGEFGELVCGLWKTACFAVMALCEGVVTSKGKWCTDIAREPFDVLLLFIVETGCIAKLGRL